VATIVETQDEIETARERSRRRRQEDQRRRQRRRLLLLAAAVGGSLAFIVGVVIAGSGGGSDQPAGAEAKPVPVPQLPGGGHKILPGRRVVAFYGTVNSPVLGTLGRGTPAQAAARLKRVSRAYAGPGRPKVLPAFEVISTVASSAPGDGSLYRDRKPLAQIERYHRAIRKAGGILIIDIQPGRSDFFTEVQRYKKLLQEPDVSLALDPEWKMDPGQIPGQAIGHTDARSINAVSAWLSQLVTANHLPQKLLVVHQFTDGMITNRQRLKARPNLAMAIHVDGFGDPANKRQKYRQLAPRRHFYPGFKLFYKQDIDRLSPGQVLRLRPVPLLVTYQ
jgi:hypothetical protein